jgi:K+-sensing histidine kinase KdpD
MPLDEIESVDLRQVLTEVGSSICKEFSNKIFAISRSFSSKGEIMVKGGDIAGDVLRKVFDNATRYNERDVIEIGVKVTRPQGPSGMRYWQVEISDNGLGIPHSQKSVLLSTPDESHRLIRGIYSSIPFCVSLLGHIGGELTIGDRVQDQPEKGAKIVLKFPEGG